MRLWQVTVVALVLIFASVVDAVNAFVVVFAAAAAAAAVVVVVVVRVLLLW